MSTNAKIITWVIVAVAVVGGVWWWLSMSPTAVSPTTNSNPPTQTGVATTPQSNGISATDNSNAGIQTNLSNIDSQMNGFSSDNANVSQGLNDQPVQQASL